MYCIDEKSFNEDEKNFLYKLENLETEEIIKFVSSKNLNEGDIVNIVNEDLVFLEEETIKRKNDLSNRLNKLFKK